VKFVEHRNLYVGFWGGRVVVTKRTEAAEIVDPAAQTRRDQIFFGATVTVENARGERRTVTIKGVDETDPLRGEVSWVSPIAQALLKARLGDEVLLQTPGGREMLEVLEVRYPAPG
jgi:transcription elongation factor GreB